MSKTESGKEQAKTERDRFGGSHYLPYTTGTFFSKQLANNRFPTDARTPARTYVGNGRASGRTPQ